MSNYSWALLSIVANDTNPENSNCLDFQKWFICRIEDTFHVLQLHPIGQLFLSLPLRSSESKNSMYLGHFSSAVFIDHGVQELLRLLQAIYSYFFLFSIVRRSSERKSKLPKNPQTLQWQSQTLSGSPDPHPDVIRRPNGLWCCEWHVLLEFHPFYKHQLRSSAVRSC